MNCVPPSRSVSHSGGEIGTAYASHPKSSTKMVSKALWAIASPGSPFAISTLDFVRREGNQIVILKVAY